MELDLTIIPAIVTITNVNVAPEVVTEDNVNSGVVAVPFFQTNLTQELEAGDKIKLVAQTSEALAFYLQLADTLEGVTVEAVKAA